MVFLRFIVSFSFMNNCAQPTANLNWDRAEVIGWFGRTPRGDGRAEGERQGFSVRENQTGAIRWPGDASVQLIPSGREASTRSCEKHAAYVTQGENEPCYPEATSRQFELMPFPKGLRSE